MKNYKTVMLGSVATSALLLGSVAITSPALAKNVEVGHKKGSKFNMNITLVVKIVQQASQALKMIRIRHPSLHAVFVLVLKAAPVIRN
jgi:hypothetical protein